MLFVPFVKSLNEYFGEKVKYSYQGRSIRISKCNLFGLEPELEVYSHPFHLQKHIWDCFKPGLGHNKNFFIKVIRPVDMV